MMTASRPEVKGPRPPLPDPLRGVLFDMDGVLVHSSEAWFLVLNRAAVRFGAPPVDRRLFESTFGQGVEADRDRFFPDRSVEEIVGFYDRTFPDALDAVVTAPGALDLLARLRREGRRAAVVTNAPKSTATSILAATGLDRLLDAAVAAGDAPEKPAPDLVHLALARVELTPAEVLYVGDTPTDREAAGAAGVFFVGIGVDGDRRIEALAELDGLLPPVLS